MLSVETKYFGILPCAEGAVFDFPQGLPAFEEEKSFVLIETPESAPVVFLQSRANANLCFVALPIQVVDDEYELAIAPEDLEELELDADRQPTPGCEVIVLVLVSIRDKIPPTANLMAPIILNVALRRGLQAVRHDFRYSHEHPIVSTPGSAREKAC